MKPGDFVTWRGTSKYPYTGVVVEIYEDGVVLVDERPSFPGHNLQYVFIDDLAADTITVRKLGERKPVEVAVQEEMRYD